MTAQADTTRVRPRNIGPWATDSSVGKITDYGQIASYGVMSTPALSIDDQVVLAGRVPSVAELVDLIREATR